MTETIPSPSNPAVGSTDLLAKSPPDIMIVNGYCTKQVGGEFVRVPSTLGEQLRSVETVFGAQILKKPFQVTFDPPIL